MQIGRGGLAELVARNNPTVMRYAVERPRRVEREHGLEAQVAGSAFYGLLRPAQSLPRQARNDWRKGFHAMLADRDVGEAEPLALVLQLLGDPLGLADECER